MKNLKKQILIKNIITLGKAKNNVLYIVEYLGE